MAPSTTKTGLTLAGGGVIGAALLSAYAVLTQDWKIVFMLFGGILLVAGLIFGVLWVLARMEKKRKNAQIEGATAGGSEPHTSDANERATLVKLRSQWDEGLRKLKDAGKDLYSMPWVLIVGPSGAGKTEAIRHAELLLKDRKLQNPLAGLGGTLNMNWWFSNDAVFLDTAGRMFLETVKPGQTSEWIEFLKLIKRARPKAPINGVLLVISAASLLVDSDAQITTTSEQIAERLEDIKGTLNVRFPVYVMITKSDLIPGFRAFFEDLNDADLQRQILGWANPAPLDQPFDHEVVDSHLKTVRDRLVQRRTTLLAERVAKTSGDVPILDEVDELYAFPDAFLKIAPRLRLYMQNIFVRGGWYENSRPFVRGIFFSSAMNQGAQLDKEIADMLNCDPSRVPELGTWQEDRHLFLSQLFSKKILPEHGLVTSAKNVSKRQRMQRGIIFGSIAAGLLILTGLTVFNYFVFRQSIGATARYWITVEDKMKTQSPDGKTYYDPTRLSSESVITRNANGGFAFQNSPFINLSAGMETIEPPHLFIGSFVGSESQIQLDEKRLAAQRIILEQTVLRPLISAAHDKLMAPESGGELALVTDAPRSVDKSAPTPAALAFATFSNMWKQVSHKVNAALGNEDKIPEKDLVRHLGAYVLNTPGDNLPAPLREINSRLPALYPFDAAGTKFTWPPNSLSSIDNGDVTNFIHPAVTQSVANFNDYWNKAIADARNADREMLKLTNALVTLQTIEDDMQPWAAGLTSARLQPDQLPAYLTSWSAKYAAWAAAYANAVPPAKKFDAKTSLRQAQNENVQRERANRKDAAEFLRAATEWNPAVYNTIGKESKDPSAATQPATPISAELDEGYFARGMDKDHTRLFALKNRLYAGDNALLASDLASLPENYRKLMDDIAACAPPGSPASLNRAAKTARITATLLAQARAYECTLAGINRAAGPDHKITQASIRAAVKADAKTPAQLPAIPLTVLTGGPCQLDFDPDTAADIVPNIVDVKRIGALEKTLADDNQDAPSLLVLHVDALAQVELLKAALQARNEYLASYSTYWTQTLPLAVRPATPTWNEYRAKLADAAPANVLPKLRELHEQMKAAMDKLNLGYTTEMTHANRSFTDKTLFSTADIFIKAWSNRAALKSAAELRHDILFTYTDDQRKTLFFTAPPTDIVTAYYTWIPYHAFQLLYNENRVAGIDDAALVLSTVGKQYPFNKNSPVNDTVAQAAGVHDALGWISNATLPPEALEIQDVWDHFTGQKPVHDAGLSAEALLIVRARDASLNWIKTDAGVSPGMQLLVAPDNALGDTGWYFRIRENDATILEGKLGGKPLGTGIAHPGMPLSIFIYETRSQFDADDVAHRIAINDLKSPWALMHKYDDARTTDGKFDLAIPGKDSKLRLSVTPKSDR